MFLAAGSDEVALKGFKGRSVLESATKGGQPDVVDLLLQSGAVLDVGDTPEAENDGFPLAMACLSGCPETARRLIKASGDKLKINATYSPRLGVLARVRTCHHRGQCRCQLLWLRQS